MHRAGIEAEGSQSRMLMPQTVDEIAKRWYVCTTRCATEAVEPGVSKQKGRQMSRRRHQTRWARGVAILMLSACSIAAQPAGTTTHRLTVSRFVSVDFTEEDARAMLNEMSGVLQTNDRVNGTGPEDQQCPVRFELEGSVQIFDVGTGTIENEGDFLDVIGQPGDVKVVESITWCNVPNPPVAGCAARHDSFIVEAGHVNDVAGPLWTHEFGHVRSLSDRREEPLMTMNKTVTNQSRRVANFECDRYR